MWLTINDKAYNTNRKKIFFVISLLEGDAAEWGNTYYTDYFDTSGVTEPTWDEFLTALDKQYQNPFDKERAVKAIQQSMCGRGENVADFNLRFKSLVSKGKVGDEESWAIAAYKRALPTRVFEAVLGHQTIPTKLSEWYTRAEAVDNHYIQTDMERRGIYTNDRANPFTNTRPPRTSIN